MKMPGRGMDAILCLREARTLAGDPRFSGSSMDAVRKAGLNKDININSAVTLLKTTRPPERICATILNTPPLEREQFRRRMLMDFDSAIAKLVQAAQPGSRRDVAVRAANEADNWARDLANADYVKKMKLSKFRVWEQCFEAAMTDYDARGKARGISGDEKFIEAPRPK